MSNLYAEIVVNIEAPLAGTYHYSVPRDMRRYLKIGHLVEIEFGRRVAQGIVISFANDLRALTSASSVSSSLAEPVEAKEDEPFDESLIKPVLSLINNDPVVFDWQIALAQWMSGAYLAPLNGCLRLFLPPGLTRWSDVTISMNPYWDGEGRLTELQEKIINLLKEHGDLRGKKLRPMLPKAERKKWQAAVNQLAKRDILRKASVLDAPRLRPKAIKTAELIARPEQIVQKLPEIGRKSKQADVLIWLLLANEPTPTVEQVLAGSGRERADLDKCFADGLVEMRKMGGFLPEEGGGTSVDLSDTDRRGNTDEFVAVKGTKKLVIDTVLRLKKGESYGRIIDFLASEARPVSVAAVYDFAEATLAQLKKLVKWEIVKFGAEEVWRDSMADRDFTPAEAPRLTNDQARIWGRLKSAMILAGIESEEPEDDFEDWDEPDELEDEPSSQEIFEVKPFLLHGVTGSGKTEIYMRAIEHALTAGRTAIVLVPEIALTPQTVRRFAARFPGRVAVMHSRLSDGERYDTWRRARQGLFDIVVGPRSA
ncbi:MAG: primosomal protein N' (replication factor Y), partial [Cellvibrionaceae bacterium]